jgi:hypothetical protein
VVDRSDAAARFAATCTAVRDWSLAHRHDYALLYGSPVTGYAAPQDTIEPATRVIRRLVEIVIVAHSEGSAKPVPDRTDSTVFGSSIEGARAALQEFGLVLTDAPIEIVGRTLMAWTTIFGSISFELWGHLVGSVTDHAAYFDGVVARLWTDLGG